MRLILRTDDEEHEVESGKPFHFGRVADLVVDADNPYMHRVVGIIQGQDDVWWIFNNGDATAIELASDDGFLTIVPPGTQAAMSRTEAAIRFKAGATTYEIDYSIEAAQAPQPIRPEDRPGETTVRFGFVGLNLEQRAMLTAFAEDGLRNNRRLDTVPTNSEVARKLGWTSKKLERKLDHLCGRLADEGVEGVRGGTGTDALHRRLNLANHAIEAMLVTEADLVLLEAPDD